MTTAAVEPSLSEGRRHAMMASAPLADIAYFVTAVIVETWERLLANKELRELPKSLNDLRPLMEVRAEALGVSVEHYVRDLVLAEARAASAREH